jgi:hypothetical protein
MKRFLIIGVLVVSIILGLIINYTKISGMSPVWIGPYLSGSANYTLGSDFKIDLPEVKQFAELSYDQQLKYRFSKSKDLVEYNLNDIGYVLLIRSSTFLFGQFAGDMQAIILLQLLVHLIISFTILYSLKENSKIIIFSVLYVANPVILYFVVFNFYYFWQLVPPALCIWIYYFNPQKNLGLLSIIAVLCALIILTRPTVLFVGLLLSFLVVNKYGWKPGALFIGLLISCLLILHAPSQKNLWHTTYIGIGAYENEYKIALSDIDGAALYEEKTGERMSTSLGGNAYEYETAERYKRIAKERYFEIIKDNPLMIVRNAALNIFQSFGVGYINKGSDTINYLTSLLGFAILALLISRGKYFLTLLIITTNITFILYYPPIPAYNLGAYLPLAFALTLIMHEFLRFFQNSLSKLNKRRKLLPNFTSRPQ